MSEYVLADKNDLSKIAEALRSASGSNETYTVPELSTAAVQTISSGGGGGGSVSWNDLTDKPFYEEQGEAYIYENITAVMNSDAEMAYLTKKPSSAAKADSVYTVVWNGTEYETNSYYYNDGEMEGVAIGNLGAITGENPTGEPFLFILLAAVIDGLWGIAIPLDGSETATFSILGEGTIVKTIDEKYIPDNMLRSYCVEIDFDRSNNSLHLGMNLTSEAYHSMVQKGWTIYAIVYDYTSEQGRGEILSYPKLESMMDYGLLFKNCAYVYDPNENKHLIENVYLVVDFNEGHVKAYSERTQVTPVFGS